MTTIGDRIRMARQAKKLKQGELAKLLGVARSVISNWENNLNQPTGDKIVQLCRALDISLSYLFDYYGGQVRPMASEDHERLQKFQLLDEDGRDVVDAVLSLEARRCARQQITAAREAAPQATVIPFIPFPVSAGTGVQLSDSQAEHISVVSTPQSQEADFVLQVAGDSMEPEYHDGDLLLVKKTDVVELGQLGIFAVNGEGYFKRSGRGQLESLNPVYEPIQLSEWDHVTTFGRVLGTAERIPAPAAPAPRSNLW